VAVDSSGACATTGRNNRPPGAATIQAVEHTVSSTADSGHHQGASTSGSPGSLHCAGELVGWGLDPASGFSSFDGRPRGLRLGQWSGGYITRACGDRFSRTSVPGLQSQWRAVDLDSRASDNCLGVWAIMAVPDAPRRQQPAGGRFMAYTSVFPMLGLLDSLGAVAAS